MNKNTESDTANRHQTTTPLRIVDRLRGLTAPLDQVGRLIRWHNALAKAAQTDQGNPAMPDILDLVLLSIEDVNDPTARVERAEVHMQGKTLATFNFPIIQLALIAKVGEAWGPDGPTDQDVTVGGLKARLLAVFRRYHQDYVLNMTVNDYEAKLTTAGMLPEKARDLSRLIVSVLAGGRAAGIIEDAKPLNQFASEYGGDTPSCSVVKNEARKA